MLNGCQLGIFGWLFNNGSTPLITSFSQASADMVDFHNCVVFEALHYGDNYLRIDASFNLVEISDFFVRMNFSNTEKKNINLICT